MPRKTAKLSKRSRIRLSQARFRELVEGAPVDAWGESEQAVGWMTMIQENVGFPFESELLGVGVKVVGVDVTDASELVAVCRKGKNRLKIPLADPRAGIAAHGAQRATAAQAELGKKVLRHACHRP